MGFSVRVPCPPLEQALEFQLFQGSFFMRGSIEFVDVAGRNY